MAGLYGMSRTNHDFEVKEGWGKNTFTNTFPIAVGQYLHGVLGKEAVQIEAFLDSSNRLTTRQRLVNWRDVIGADPSQARFDFEVPFAPYGTLTAAGRQPEKSDVVVSDGSGIPKRALEIKLTAVPDSASSNRDHDRQSSEIVCRPATIEQLAYSICMSYGASDAGRMEINSAILEHIRYPQQTDWHDESRMRQLVPRVCSVIEDIILARIDDQLPAVLNVIWRTEGKRPVLLDDCFDVFCWTNFGFLMMFLDASRPSARSTRISRHQRSLIWLTKMLHDYSSQRYLDRKDTFRTITFGTQTDKAGAFSGPTTNRYLGGQYLSTPRVPSQAVDEIVLGGGSGFLAPERRLDAAIYIEMIREGVTTAESPE